jgi:hypothetical protein
MNRCCTLALLLALGAGTALPAWAQRPFHVYDPFYRSETARRAFHEAYAVSGEVSYRAAGAAEGGASALAPDPLGLAFRLDYALTDNLEAGVIVDAAGAADARAMRWSWVVLTYHRTEGFDDFAFRLALDPDSDGRVGFPQADLALIASSVLSPRVSSDFVIGARRVQRGYQQYEALADAPTQPLEAAQPSYALHNARALGYEANLMVTYNLHLGPSGSKAYLGFLGQHGEYRLHRSPDADPAVEALIVAASAAGAESPTLAADEVQRFRGGVLWVRPGLEYHRPHYRLTPFLNLPLVQWNPRDGQRARPHVGVQLMLR